MKRKYFGSIITGNNHRNKNKNKNKNLKVPTYSEILKQRRNDILPGFYVSEGLGLRIRYPNGSWESWVCDQWVKYPKSDKNAEYMDLSVLLLEYRFAG